ncbi:MAG: D-aminoacyl-tRNA deacylase [Alphaproteobacteria bacterium MarineAlpha3_Bin5]|nr:D-tyrosyl-tRNA(Tyr) deacylase [Magnetovibrio sp.]PPR80008.1 MAG: D-aminoacyl-tRNA deacylase [Alphaproteobacteria bacterium MarineAlpha3_Bin5]
MRILLQKVSEASVVIEGELIAQIEAGILIFFCAMNEDSMEQAHYLARKIKNLRIFCDDQGKMNKSILDIKGSTLVVSQFTLAADTSRGNRPGFSRAAHPDEGKRLYNGFCELLSDQGLDVKTGRFGADMAVHLVNDGPITIWLDTSKP